jgi:hypothetical protein
MKKGFHLQTLSISVKKRVLQEVGRLYSPSLSKRTYKFVIVFGSERKTNPTPNITTKAE